MEWIDVEKAQPITIDGTVFHVKPCSWPEKIDLANMVRKFPDPREDEEADLESMKSEDYDTMLHFLASKVQLVEGFDIVPYDILKGMRPVDIMKLTTGLFDISGITEAEEKK